MSHHIPISTPIEDIKPSTGHLEEGDGVMPKEEDVLQQFDPKLRRRTMLKVSRSAEDEMISSDDPVARPAPASSPDLDLLLVLAGQVEPG